MAVSFSILVKTNLQVSNLKDKTNSKTLLSESEIFIPRQCKGRTTEFGSVGRGSIPLRGNFIAEIVPIL